MKDLEASNVVLKKILELSQVHWGNQIFFSQERFLGENEEKITFMLSLDNKRKHLSNSNIIHSKMGCTWTKGHHDTKSVGLTH